MSQMLESLNLGNLVGANVGQQVNHERDWEAAGMEYIYWDSISQSGGA